jgi:hypothetical protein
VLTVTGSAQQAASSGQPSQNAPPQNSLYPQVVAELTSTEYALAQIIGAAKSASQSQLSRRTVMQYLTTVGGIQPSPATNTSTTPTSGG